MEVINENSYFNEIQDPLINDHSQQTIYSSEFLEQFTMTKSILTEYFQQVSQSSNLQFIFDAARNLVLNSSKSIIAETMCRYRIPIICHIIHIIDQENNNINVSKTFKIHLDPEEYNEYKIILHFLHKNELVIDCLSDAISCYRIAHTVDIPTFKLACVDYLLQFITYKNVVNIYDKLVRSTILPVDKDSIRLPDPYLERIADIYYTRNSIKEFLPAAPITHVNEYLQSYEIINFEINLPIQIYGIGIYGPISSDWTVKSVEVEISMKEDCYFSDTKVVKRNIYNIKKKSNNSNDHDMYKIYFNDDVTIRPDCMYKLCVNYDTSIPDRGTVFYSGRILKNEWLHTKYNNNYNKVIDSSCLSIQQFNGISRIHAIYYKTYPQLLTFNA